MRIILELDALTGLVKLYHDAGQTVEVYLRWADHDQPTPAEPRLPEDADRAWAERGATQHGMTRR